MSLFYGGGGLFQRPVKGGSLNISVFQWPLTSSVHLQVQLARGRPLALGASPEGCRE